MNRILKKINPTSSFIALLLLVTTFSTHKTCAMEPNEHQKDLLRLCESSLVTSEILAEFKSLCKEPDVDLNFFYPIYHNMTLLMIAAELNKCHIIQILLDNEADINKAISDGTTALMIAADWSNTDAIKCLLKNRRLAINQQDNRGWTALMYAILRNAPSTVALLLNAEADPEITDFYDNKPWDLAQGLGNQEIIHLMREAIQIKRLKEQTAELKEQTAGG